MSAVLLISYPRSPKTTRMSLRQAEKTRARYELKQGQSRVFHQLPSGLSMEVIVQKRRSGKEEKAAPPPPPPPPLVLVHGSFHAAWCWAEHWMPFFSKYGHDCYAVSLLGQGESDLPSGPAAGTLQTHASDVAHFIEKEVELEPVLVGHSFGGLIVQYYISSMMSGHLRDQTSGCGKKGLHPALAGAVLVCSVPPSGNSGLVWRYLRSKPVAAFKLLLENLRLTCHAVVDCFHPCVAVRYGECGKHSIDSLCHSETVTLSLAAKAFATSLPLCRETFFSAGMEDHNVQRYQELMKESSRMPLFDLRKLNSSLPPPSVPKDFVKMLIMGASDDFIVDKEGLDETAQFYGVSPTCIRGIAHDMMLDTSWEKAARVLLSWLNMENLPTPGHYLYNDCYKPR